MLKSFTGGCKVIQAEPQEKDMSEGFEEKPRKIVFTIQQDKFGELMSVVREGFEKHLRFHDLSWGIGKKGNKYGWPSTMRHVPIGGKGTHKLSNGVMTWEEIPC